MPEHNDPMTNTLDTLRSDVERLPLSDEAVRASRVTAARTASCRSAPWGRFSAIESRKSWASMTFRSS